MTASSGSSSIGVRPMTVQPWWLQTNALAETAPNLEQAARYLMPRTPLAPPDGHYLKTPGRQGMDVRPDQLRAAGTDSRGSIRVVKNLLPASGGVVRDMGEDEVITTFRADHETSPRPQRSPKRAFGTAAEERWRAGLQEPRLHAGDSFRAPVRPPAPNHFAGNSRPVPLSAFGNSLFK